MPKSGSVYIEKSLAGISSNTEITRGYDGKMIAEGKPRRKRVQLISPDQVLRELPASKLVVYDAGNSIAAARAWWLLRYFGHPDVRLLDGGFSGWLAAGNAIERAVTAPEGGDFVASAGGMPLLDAESAATVAREGVLLDARVPERFRGEREPVDPVAGHIPGAVNVPAASLVKADGRFRDSDALRRVFENAGVRDGVAVGAYCGSGVAASHEVLALSLAGIPAALYVGSWSDWITDPRRPVGTGGS